MRFEIRPIVLVFFVILALCTLTSCSHRVSHMIPDNALSPHHHIDKTITVKEVTGGKKCSLTQKFVGLNSFVPNDLFKETLVEALKKSRLFKEVTAQNGDLALYANIKTQTYTRPNALETRAFMIVEYKILNTKDNRLIWTETYESAFSSTAFAADVRMVEAREGCVRENIALLIEGIDKRWPANF